MDFTCLEIRNIKYIKLLPLDSAAVSELDLTTIHRDQELAYLKIFYVDEKKNKKILKNIEINNIRPGKSGIPELALKVDYDGSRYYKIILKLNGYIYHNSIIDIRNFRKKSFPLRVVTIPLILLAITALVFGAIRLLSPKEIDSGMRVGEKESVKDVVPEVEVEPVSEAVEPQRQDTVLPTEKEEEPEETPEPPLKTEEEVVVQPEPEEVQESVEEEASTVAETESVNEEEVKPPAQLIDDQAVVYFFPNSTVLTEDTVNVLNEILEILRNNENLDVEIIGHCAFFGTEKGRQEISEERAINVYDYFTGKGWIPESKPLLQGKGHSDLVTRDPDLQNLNRRVEIFIRSRVED